MNLKCAKPVQFGIAFPLTATAVALGRNARTVDHVHPAEEIHLTMLTDREVGAAAALQSVCKNSANPARLRFHIIGPSKESDPNVEETWNFDRLAKACATGGAVLNLYSMAEMTERVEDAGFSPAWKWRFDFQPSNYSVHPADWDNSPTHNHPFNLIRFYLPHIQPFKDLKQVLFMDDDVIIQKDVVKAWDFELLDDKVMSASCHNWVWSDCDRFDSSTSLSYLDVPYLGIGRLGTDRNADYAVCANEQQRECVPQGFFELLAEKSREINGEDYAITLGKLDSAKAFNYGFNKFDLDAWRAHGITEKYVKWVEFNRDSMLFPTTSLAYGLGIAMLAKIGRVQCFDDDTPVVQGLGFVGTKDMRGAGQSIENLRSSFGLHFNGPRKPWKPSEGNPYSDIFLEYAQKSVRKEFHDASALVFAQRNFRMNNNKTSFVIITDPRSGSEWFMEMLDQHNEICASGEKDDSAVGFPREALIPGRYHYMAAQRKSGVKASMMQIGTSWAHAAGVRHGQSSKNSAYMKSNYLRSYRRMSRLASDVDGEEFVGIRTCQAKAACSWGNIAPLLWRASAQNDTCSGDKLDWLQNSERLGYGMHLNMLCQIIKQAEARIKRVNATPEINPAAVVEEAFRIYFRQQMREQLHLNDAAYGSKLEGEQLLPCRCPKSAVTTGQKLMNEWIGDLPEGGAAANDWKSRPYDVNFNALSAHQKLGAPYLDIFSAMQEVGTRAIIFHRANLLARFVSLQTASSTNIYHCEDEKCVSSMAKSAVTVDVKKLMHFINWNREVQKRNLDLLGAKEIPTLTIAYEDCRADTHACLQNVTSFLGVKMPAEDLAAMAKGRRLSGALRDQISNAAEVRQVLVNEGLERWIDDSDLS